MLKNADHLAHRLNAEVLEKSVLPKMPEPVPTGPGVFLHGDPVPANVVSGLEGITFVDWQCPATGDVCEDLFIFASPAMQSLYGGAPLSDLQIQNLLSGYGNVETTARFHQLAPLLHWRMAAYCLWMAERGADDYRSVIQLELDALERCQG